MRTARPPTEHHRPRSAAAPSAQRAVWSTGAVEAFLRAPRPQPGLSARASVQHAPVQPGANSPVRPEEERQAGAGPEAILALQRSVGNAAVSALMSARFRSPGGPGVGDIDAAIKEIRGDEPAIETVEKGLRAAKAVGVPVDLEGPKPPASALAVTKTGFRAGVSRRQEAGGAAQVGTGGRARWGKPGRRRPRWAEEARIWRGARRELWRRRAAGSGGLSRGGACAGCRPGSCSRQWRQARCDPMTTQPSLGSLATSEGLRREQEGTPAGRFEGQGGARARRWPRPTTWPGRPRRPRSTPWTPSRRARSTRRRSSRR